MDATDPEQQMTNARREPIDWTARYIKWSLLCGGFAALSVGGAMWFFTATDRDPMARQWAGVAAGLAGVFAALIGVVVGFVGVRIARWYADWIARQ